MAVAGYYRDPFETDGAGRLRWWGGGAWADQTLPTGGEWAPGDANDHPPTGEPVGQDVIDAAKARQSTSADRGGPGSTVRSRTRGVLLLMMLVAAVAGVAMLFQADAADKDLLVHELGQTLAGARFQEAPSGGTPWRVGAMVSGGVALACLAGVFILQEDT